MFAVIDDKGFLIDLSDEDTGVPLPSTEVTWFTPKWTQNGWTEAQTQENITLFDQRIKIERKSESVKKQLTSLSVEVDGLIFSATEKSQLRMLLAINAAKKLGLTETGWVLKDDESPTLITLTQLEQAQSLAIQALGEIIVSKAGTGND